MASSTLKRIVFFPTLLIVSSVGQRPTLTKADEHRQKRNILHCYFLHPCVRVASPSNCPTPLSRQVNIFLMQNLIKI